MLIKVECLKCGTLAIASSDADGVICWECIAEGLTALDKPKDKQTKSVGYPRGWKFMKEFVHSDGTVYHKGVVQEDLKGTITPTKIEVKVKKTKAQRFEEKQALLLEYNSLKKTLLKEKRKTYIKKIQTKLKKLQKQL